MTENEHNACIVSFFMDNIAIETVDKQAKTVAKFNKSKVPHYHIKTDMRHGASMDFVWASMGISHPTFAGHDVPRRFDHDVVLFLDIDALPLNDFAIDYFIETAAAGHLIGNIQRSNHIQNNQHVFAAPSALAISQSTFLTIGKPTGLEVPSRSDVAEEYTYAAEKNGIVPLELLMPVRFDAPPAECPSWALKDGMPVYGRGTTFGSDYWNGTELRSSEGQVKSLIWHNFQSFHPGQQERFMAKCDELLKEDYNG